LFQRLGSVFLSMDNEGIRKRVTRQTCSDIGKSGALLQLLQCSIFRNKLDGQDLRVFFQALVDFLDTILRRIQLKEQTHLRRARRLPGKSLQVLHEYINACR